MARTKTIITTIIIGKRCGENVNIYKRTQTTKTNENN